MATSWELIAPPILKKTDILPNTRPDKPSIVRGAKAIGGNTLISPCNGEEAYASLTKFQALSNPDSDLKNWLVVLVNAMLCISINASSVAISLSVTLVEAKGLRLLNLLKLFITLNLPPIKKFWFSSPKPKPLSLLANSLRAL